MVKVRFAWILQTSYKQINQPKLADKLLSKIYLFSNIYFLLQLKSKVTIGNKDTYDLFINTLMKLIPQVKQT